MVAQRIKYFRFSYSKKLSENVYLIMDLKSTKKKGKVVTKFANFYNFDAT